MSTDELLPATCATGRGAAWLSEAWQLVRRKPGSWIGMFVVMHVLLLVALLVPGIGGLLSAAATPWLVAGLMLAADAEQRGEPMPFELLFAGFPRDTAPLLLLGLFNALAGLVVMLVIAVPLLLFAGGIALSSDDPAALLAQIDQWANVSLLGVALVLSVVAALLLPVLMALWFAPALVVLGRVPAGSALRLSVVACVRNWLPFLSYGLVGLALAVLATLPALLGWLVLPPFVALLATLPLLAGWLLLGPVLYASIYASYRDVFAAA